jgi:hypothetical protein
LSIKDTCCTVAVQQLVLLGPDKLVAEDEHELVVEALKQPNYNHHESVGVPIRVGVEERVVLGEEVVRLPGIGPGSPAWGAGILPLDHSRSCTTFLL